VINYEERIGQAVILVINYEERIGQAVILVINYEERIHSLSYPLFIIYH
jgi:hypothetical protein